MLRKAAQAERAPVPCFQVDFGLSKILAEQRQATETTGVANNPVWLAPEVLAGGQATAASDVYAFGLVRAGVG